MSALKRISEIEAYVSRDTLAKEDAFDANGATDLADLCKALRLALEALEFIEAIDKRGHKKTGSILFADVAARDAREAINAQLGGKE